MLPLVQTIYVTTQYTFISGIFRSYRKAKFYSSRFSSSYTTVCRHYSPLTTRFNELHKVNYKNVRAVKYRILVVSGPVTIYILYTAYLELAGSEQILASCQRSNNYNFIFLNGVSFLCADARWDIFAFSVCHPFAFTTVYLI